MKYFSIIPLIFILTACDEETHAVQPNTYVKSSEIVKGMDGCRRLEVRHASSSTSPYSTEIVYQCDNPTYLQLDTTTDNGYTAAGVLDDPIDYVDPVLGTQHKKVKDYVVGRASMTFDY